MTYLGNLPLSDGAAALELLFAQKSDIDHRHSISDVDGLADALAGGGGGGDIPYADTSVAGKIRIATSTDTTSNDKAVTPASMANFVNNAINNIGDYNGVYGSGVYTIFKTPGVTTFNTPAGVTEARVTVIGPGGDGIDPTTGALAAGGGGGGFAQGIYPVSGSYNVTVGTPGGSSSFGTLLSATSGENGASVNGNLVGGNGGNGVGGNLVNRRGGRGSGGPVAPAEYINFTELPTGSGTIPSGVTTVTMISKGGDVVASGSIYGSGKPWVKQYAFNDLQSTDITGWTNGTSLPGGLYGSQAVVTKNRVYLLGGYADQGVTSVVYTAPINSDGTLGTWTTGTSLPGGLFHSQAVVTKNRVYLLGGYTDQGVATAVVYTAPFAGGLNDYTDVVANGGDGTASTITFNGTLYTFPGGSSISPAVTTTFNISLPGTTAAAYSYTKPTVGTELSITYSSSSIGAPTTITVNGVVYTFPGGVNGPAVQSIQNAYLTGNSAVNYSYNIAPGGLGAISYQVAGGGDGGVSDSSGTAGGASGCYSEAFMRDAYGNNGGGFGNGMDTSVTTSGVTSVAHNFSGGGGNNSSTGGGKGGIGGGGGGGAIGGNGLVIVEW